MIFRGVIHIKKYSKFAKMSSVEVDESDELEVPGILHPIADICTQKQLLFGESSQFPKQLLKNFPRAEKVSIIPGLKDIYMDESNEPQDASSQPYVDLDSLQSDYEQHYSRKPHNTTSFGDENFCDNRNICDANVNKENCSNYLGKYFPATNFIQKPKKTKHDESYKHI